MKKSIYRWGNNHRIETILSLEDTYPVHEWKINGIHIWPIIRSMLYLEMWAEKERKPIANAHASTQAPGKPTPARTISITKRIGYLLRFGLFWLLPLKKSKALFVSAPGYLETYEDKPLHRFFDPMRRTEPDYRNAYLVFSRGVRVEGITDQLHVSSFNYVLHVFSRFYRKRGFSHELEGFSEFIADLSKETTTAKRITLPYLEEAVVGIEKYAFLFKILLKKTRAKEAISLCYYNDTYEHFGLNIAAHRLGVTSVDLQHGGQGIHHLAYSQFYKLPKSRCYALLPKEFWCWDELSAEPIHQWISETNAIHRVRITGHPWFKYLRVARHKSSDKPIIVYSLQPFQTLLLPQVVEAIKLSQGRCMWILRLHPSMNNRANELQSLIMSNHIADAIHSQTFSPLSLPETLAEAALHMTRTSGTVIEATLMGVTTLILDGEGATAFAEYVALGKAIDAEQWTGADIARYIEAMPH